MNQNKHQKHEDFPLFLALKDQKITNEEGFPPSDMQRLYKVYSQ